MCNVVCVCDVHAYLDNVNYASKCDEWHNGDGWQLNVWTLCVTYIDMSVCIILCPCILKALVSSYAMRKGIRDLINRFISACHYNNAHAYTHTDAHHIFHF